MGEDSKREERERDVVDGGEMIETLGKMEGVAPAMMAEETALSKAFRRRVREVLGTL